MLISNVRIGFAYHVAFFSFIHLSSLCLFLAHSKFFRISYGWLYGIRVQYLIKSNLNFANSPCLSDVPKSVPARSCLRVWLPWFLKTASGLHSHLIKAEQDKIWDIESNSAISFSVTASRCCLDEFFSKSCNLTNPSGPSLPITLNAKSFLRQYTLYRIWSSDMPDSKPFNARWMRACTWHHFIGLQRDGVSVQIILWVNEYRAMPRGQFKSKHNFAFI